MILLFPGMTSVTSDILCVISVLLATAEVRTVMVGSVWVTSVVIIDTRLSGPGDVICVKTMGDELTDVIPSADVRTSETPVP